MNDSSNPLTWITTYVLILLLILFGADARSAPLRSPAYSSSARNALSELAIEMFFPADEATARAVRRAA